MPMLNHDFGMCESDAQGNLIQVQQMLSMDDDESLKGYFVFHSE